MNTEKEKIKKNATREKNKYIICKADQDLRNRLQKIAHEQKRSMSNLVNCIVEEWLDDNEDK